MDRRSLLKAGVAGAAFTAAPYFFTRPSQAQGKYKEEYKLSTVVGLPFPWGQGGDIWAKLVRERTEGRINIKMYPGVSLVNGDQTREFTAIRQGVIDLAVGSTINWSPQIKQLNLFSLPFLSQDHAGLDALVQGEVGKEIMQLVEKNGVVPLAWGENGFREVTNSKREIRTPADMKGLKFRVVGSPIFNDTFTALGANPTQMSWADAQPALASGAVEGQENPLHIFTAAKLHTLAQKFVTRWGYVADPLIFVANKDVWNSWSAKDRDIVRQAAIDAGKQEIAIARKGLTPDDQSLVKEVAALGVTVTELTAAEKEAFKQAVKPAYDKWAQQIGMDLVKKAEAAVAARKKA
ncbi:MAG TPA: DctP family TRAP transporter solute-binding subunit [Ferrovibrio sp.]|uniref:DctP family TRAP transporter solute-binding subunit n=1 Tax=Ferrovibrio sp. TaxID=1917215 RepID=UPI002B4AAF1F|nr:DctP family TRAP transporter solute-binding subunit [Ferrovibrio sp.]HLT78026.1 DctP family TRAP transporter solute-binding subunit [Ferrovibrio sp.]